MGGGLDSTALLLFLRDRFRREPKLHALHVNYGQKAYLAEARSVEYFCQKYDVPVKTMNVDLRSIAHAAILYGSSVGVKQEENRLEGRNVVLISLAATYASTIGAGVVYVGFHNEPVDAPFPDATLDFLRIMMPVLAKAYRPSLLLDAPFVAMSRLEVLRSGLRRDEEILTRSYTCYEEGYQECGRCVHCKTKQEMLAQLEAERCVE